MANPTTNYGFVLPSPTDLVTDLPADFDVALQGVDTRLKALQPGTTLGDIAYSSATANTNTRLAVGSTGDVLTVAGGVPTWAAPPAAGGMTLLSTTTASGASTTVSSISGAYNTLKVYLLGIAYNSNDNFFFRPNGNSAITSYSGVNYTPAAISTMNGDMNIGANVTAGLALRSVAITIDNYASATHYKSFLSYGIVNAGDRPALIAGSIGTTAAITSFTIINPSATFSGGTILVYGVN